MRRRFRWVAGLMPGNRGTTADAVPDGDEAIAPADDHPEESGAEVKPLAVSSDIPIREPSQDAYGVDGFASALARSISGANASEGLVFAVNGPWGSGKSSACNLILFHLQGEIEASRIVPVTFNPWWFSGAEVLTNSFFQELNASIGQSLPEQAREAFASLGARISSAGPLLGGLATLLGNPAAAGALSGGAKWLGGVSKINRTVDEEHAKLSEALREQDKKFLILIDDIDRLEVDEALQMFRLVKSVGRLPNVVYLLAFDRTTAERMVNERFPSEGPGYLEKFIQGGFDLPLPDSHDLREGVLRVIQDVMGAPEEQKITRFWNLFYEIVAPVTRLPRDAVRLSNAIRVTWPAVQGEVDRTDFLALETLRLFFPSVHRAIRANPDKLCGATDRERRDQDAVTAEYNRIFLNHIDEHQRAMVRRAILRLFPRTEFVWSNVMHGDDENWQRDRLVCSRAHFPTYFSFAVDEGAVTSSEVEQVLQAVGNQETLADLLRGFATQTRRKGGTRASLILEDLMIRVDDISDDSVPSVIGALFAVSDDLDVEADEDRGFGGASNHFRVHWLLNRLVRERYQQEERGRLIEEACRTASLEWLVSICSRCRDEYQRPQEEGQEPREPLVPRDVCERMDALCLDRLRQAAEDGALVEHRHMLRLLFRWRDLVGVETVREWTDGELASDVFVVALSEALISSYWSQGMGFAGLGDLVSRRTEYVNLDSVAEILDVERFRQRVDELLARDGLSDDDRQRLQHFVDTPERDPERD